MCPQNPVGAGGGAVLVTREHCDGGGDALGESGPSRAAEAPR